MEASIKKKKREHLVKSVVALLNKGGVPYFRCATCQKLFVYEKPHFLFTYWDECDWGDDYCAACTAHCDICKRDYPAEDKDCHVLNPPFSDPDDNPYCDQRDLGCGASVDPTQSEDRDDS